MLSNIANKLEIQKYLLLSRGEAKSEGKSRQLILANAFEALIGALYLDAGYEATVKFVNKYLISNLKDIIEQKLYLDPKSHLQEIAQEKLGITPTYKVLSEEGPDHAKQFSVGCFIQEKMYGKGKGSSKQTAESAAAADALDHWPKD